MESKNVRSEQGITLVGGGAPSAKNIAEALSFAPTLVAADGGANYCADLGLEPSAIIGDFDSLDADVRTGFAASQMIEVSDWQEQDTTDFQKCLERLFAPFVLAVGFSDARLDHTLANLAALAQRQGPPTILIGTHDVVFASPAEIDLDVSIGTRLSLFPMEPMQGRSGGLEWPIDGLTLAPLGRLGTSNRTTGPVRLTFKKPGCLVLTPRATLQAVMQALVD
ncbi:MAG: thiamine diphosphokinase [Paracoccaceae bacterium]